MNQEAINIAKDCVGQQTTVRVYRLTEPDSFVAVVSGILNQLQDNRFWITNEASVVHFAPESITSAAIERTSDGTYRGIYVNKSQTMEEVIKEITQP